LIRCSRRMASFFIEVSSRAERLANQAGAWSGR
jgi:hypothetical protein